MARTVTADDYFETDTAAFTGPPFTVNAWVKPTNITGRAIVFTLVDKSSTLFRMGLEGRGDVGGDPVRAFALGFAQVGIADTSSGFSADVWHMMTKVCASTTDRRAFLDGANKGTNTTTVTVSGIDRTSVGRLGDSSPEQSGQTFDVAEISCYSGVLSDAEIAALFLAGPIANSAFFVRPDILTNYWRCLEDSVTADLIDIVGGLNLTQVSSPAVADHVPVIYPAPRATWSIPSAAAGQTITPTGLTTGEVVPNPQLNLIILPTGLVTGETIPGPVMELFVTPTGIATGEVVPSQTIFQVQTITPTGLATGEVVPSQQLNLTMFPAALASGETVPSPVMELFIASTGLVTGEVVPNPQLNLIVLPTGLITGESIGTGKLNLTIFPTALATGESIGGAAMVLFISPAGIASGESIGGASLTITTGLNIVVTGISTAESIGAIGLIQFEVSPVLYIPIKTDKV